MGRRTNLLSAIAKAHARSVREAEAQRRAYAADQMRRERLRAAEARAEAAEVRAAYARARAHSAALGRAVKEVERAQARAQRKPNATRTLTQRGRHMGRPGKCRTTSMSSESCWRIHFRSTIA